MINYKEVTPKAPQLLAYIQSYTYSIGSLNETDAKFITRALPTVMTQLYFEFEGGLSAIETNGKRVEVAKRTYISCGLSSWMDIYQIGSQQKTRAIKNFKVELYPHTLFEVFGISPIEVMNEDLSLVDIFGLSDASLLYEELEASDDGEKMIEIFEKYFINRLLKKTIKQNTLTPHLLNSSQSIKLLAEETGYSQRWIQKQCRETMGVSLKKIQNNKRFLKILDNIHRKVLSGEEKINFTQLVYEGNYYDQAHFIREFKQNTGMTPSLYLSQKYQYLVSFFW
ncbi:MAG TPA: helix-turn-helix domain-containing protein [Leucothrix mucor]|uniref:Helix-turn-helix domain-containing protein n=1 Tax=Leucothrix mucor TaxID=45248 RepID=A0A7V2SY91_LEUMU|nr:helix-turn-helix domain-containing protein [Leucothrix mucor]